MEAIDERLANATLMVPENPQVFGFQTENAFGDLSFQRPVAIARQPGRNDRVFVVEQAGRVYGIELGESPERRLFLDIRDRVDSSDNEEGLLGMAFHPDWETNRQVFFFYTINTTVNGQFGRYDRLARYQISPEDEWDCLEDSELPLLSQLDQAGNHNGGDIHFGSDGFLYVSLGDEGGGGDNYDNSRFIDKDFFGAIMRIDVDRQPGSLQPNSHPAVHLDENEQARYSIPADNPFIGADSFRGVAVNPGDVRTEFWAVGLRNAWRMSFDDATGVLYAAEVGQNAYEEVNVVRRGGDYGWRLREGFQAFNGNLVPDGVSLDDPILDYPHSSGPNIPGGSAQGRSITGGVVYNGHRLGQLNGAYVFGDYVSNRVFSLRYDAQNGVTTDFQQLATVNNPSAFAIDPSNGDVLIVRHNGTIERLIYSDTPLSGEPIPETLSETGAFSDLVALEPETGVTPYAINQPFWSDFAIKSRWFSIPDIEAKIEFSDTGNWTFPSGTVWIKHFEIETVVGDPSSRRRLETRFLVKNDSGIHGFTYKWNEAETEAHLVDEAGEDELIEILDGEGQALRQQAWRYPARSECLQCHTPVGGYAAGFGTAQLNRLIDYGSGETDQLRRLSDVGYFVEAIGETEILPKLANAEDDTASLEYRARSYLHANCVSCHQPGGTAQGFWDARQSTAILDAGVLNGELVNNEGDPNLKVVVLGDPANSMLLRRISTRGEGSMPPLASSELDARGIALLSEWIANLSSRTEARLVSATVDRVEIALAGSPNADYRVLGSSDLSIWVEVGTARTDEKGEAIIALSLDPHLGTRFFRATEVEDQ